MESGPLAPGDRGGAGRASRRGLWEVLVVGALGGVRGEDPGSFRDALRGALARPVLPYQARRLYVAAMLLGLLATMVLTGCLLTPHFAPTAGSAFESARGIDQTGFGTWFSRQMHVWCGRLAVLLAAVTIVRMLFAADYKVRGHAKWVAANLLLLTLLSFFATGVRLPSGGTAIDATSVLANALGDVPIIGGVLRAVLVEPESNPQASLTRCFLLHVVFLPWVMFLLVAIVHSTRTRPGPLAETGFGPEKGAAPLWPDRTIESGIAVLVALAFAAAASLAWPVDLGGPSAPAGGARVDPVFKPLIGIVAVFPKSSGSAFLGPASAVILFCAGALVFFLLAFFDRSPERSPMRRKPIVIAGSLWFAFCLALALFGSGRP